MRNGMNTSLEFAVVHYINSRTKRVERVTAMPTTAQLLFKDVALDSTLTEYAHVKSFHCHFCVPSSRTSLWSSSLPKPYGAHRCPSLMDRKARKSWYVRFFCLDQDHRVTNSRTTKAARQQGHSLESVSNHATMQV